MLGSNPYNSPMETYLFQIKSYRYLLSLFEVEKFWGSFYGFYIPFNTFQVVSGRCLLITGYDNQPLCSVVSLKYHSAGTVTWNDPISPGHILLATGQSGFALNYPFYVERLSREIQLPIWNLWLDSALNRTPAFQTRSERSKHSATELHGRSWIFTI